MTLLYRDDWLAAVDKPSGELVHPGWGRGEATTMSRLRDAVGRHVHPVHRLDRGASGVLLMALDPDTAARLGAAWAKGEVSKRYLALVRGSPPEEGVIDHPVRRGEVGDARVSAVTRFARLAVSPVARASLVRAEPRTGRLHQIRRHFKHLSHPLLGDVNYGDGAMNRAMRELGLRRLALHAEELSLPHPVTGERLVLRAPLPPDLSEVLGRLGIAASGWE